MSRVAKRKDSNGRVLPDGVSERADGRYIYRYSLYGKPHYLYDRDLNELKKKIQKLQLDIASGVNTDLGKLSMNEWYPQYVEVFKVGKVKDATLMNLRNYYKWYIQDYTIGRMPMKELKRSFVVAHFKYLADEKGLAEGTLKALASMLYNCLQQVVYDSGLFVNPASEIMKDVKSTPKTVREAMTDEEVALLLEFLKIEGAWQNINLPFIGVMLGTGIRFGEGDALTWNDVDFENRVLHINKTMNYRCKNSSSHEFFITTPKTPSAVRDIPLDEDMIALFKMQKQYQKSLRIRNDIEIDGYKNFVFTTKLGNPFTSEGFCATIKRIVKAANEWEKERAEKEGRQPVVLPHITPHIFRHTFCTKLVLSEVPYEITKTIMGHRSIKTTIDIYSHIKEANTKKVRASIDGIVKIF